MMAYVLLLKNNWVLMGLHFISIYNLPLKLENGISMDVDCFWNGNN